MNIDIVDSIDEKINLFNETYDTDIVAVFPDRKEIYVRDMGEFLKSFFAEWDDDVFVDTDHNMRTVENLFLPKTRGIKYSCKTTIPVIRLSASTRLKAPRKKRLNRVLNVNTT